ncbi:precorrin-4 C(11)-methyltransferase [Herbivorax sp. ANBcel31]|uniref:precorrin-4 C(11)-methyltransferase n=1 Tax=Herbivorax sp. ANBcel31 TaxID=3069754 RepID=UPI0027B3131F|nr:precorrin-4 C(11)-methyltransferase [Herbivorax sp. ANBcel31]MDQ2086946.1 precorrin-4 C(11)-methyltransferase [Herbivorax sp. ANBcel31]
MVVFVGAGSGDPELITVKGKKLIEEADVIIFAGSLVNEEILKWSKESCEKYNSAKMTLDEVIKVMKDKKNKLVVRLHTGDPSIYGAIREQMDQLRRLRIDYEVIPGVSAFSAAAAALKKEYTLPGVTQTLILTRMEGRTGVPKKERIELLAKHNATMVIFLSVHMMSELVERLKCGYEDKTPVAVVYKASWPKEKIVRGTLENIAGLVEKEGIKKTALVVVGDFLGDEYELSKLYDKNFSHEFRK